MVFNQKTLDLDCGIVPTRILVWMTDELGLTQDGSGAFCYEYDGQVCTACITPLGKRGHGHFALDRTQLIVSGSEPAVDAFNRLFTLRFLSAGG